MGVAACLLSTAGLTKHTRIQEKILPGDEVNLLGSQDNRHS